MRRAAGHPFQPRHTGAFLCLRVARRVQQALKEADKAESHKTATASASPSATESTSAEPTKKSTTAGKTDDLSDSCAYHPVKD